MTALDQNQSNVCSPSDSYRAREPKVNFSKMGGVLPNSDLFCI